MSVDSSSASTDQTSPAASNGAADAADDGGRLRSTIVFPYGSLRDAEQIAESLHDTWGDSASQDQLAAGLKTTTRSGAFRTKLATARIFGLVDVARGKVSLTPSGRQIVDPTSRTQARVDAFLHVPLFAAIFDAYKDALLPPDNALENKMAELGVSAKQTAKARQAFQRSAERAGFFKHGRNRLVRPPDKVGHSGAGGKRDDDGSKETPVTPPLVPHTGASAGGVPLPELWLRLLNESESWSAEKVQAFVEKARELRAVLDD